MAARPDPAVTCDSCGTHTGVDSSCCGRCATDYNDRDQAAGRRRIDGRRRVNGLPPLDPLDTPHPADVGRDAENLEDFREPIHGDDLPRPDNEPGLPMPGDRW